MKTLLDYFMAHVDPLKTKPGFYVVKQNLKAFKKVVSPRSRVAGIANLIVPVGAQIYLDSYNLIALNDASLDVHDRGRFQSRSVKLRASFAHVHSICALAQYARSRKRSYWVAIADETFLYRAGQDVTPSNGFSFEPNTCAPGIHFFLTIGEALEHL